MYISGHLSINCLWSNQLRRYVVFEAPDFVEIIPVTKTRNASRLIYEEIARRDDMENRAMLLVSRVELN